MGPSSLLSVLLGVFLLPMDLHSSASFDARPSPVILMIEVCPPVNSSWHVMDHVGDKCVRDNQCLRSKKCCCTESGRQCVNPVQVKPGRCPPSPTACPHILSQPTCRSDVNCSDDQKCCDVCGKACWRPDPDPDGSCPVPEIILTNPSCSKIQCASDSECTSDKKCCVQVEGQKCTKVPSALNTQDMCPSAKNQHCSSPPKSQCKNDRECPKPQKCCCSNCGWTCVAPVKVKPGRCPAQDTACMEIDYPLCKSDSDCLETQKCCNRCGWKCSNPEPEPPGVCPVSEIPDVYHLQCSSVMCSSNEDCSPQRQCCLTEDSQKCVQPQPEVLHVCPPFSPDICTVAIHGINKCRNDSDCDSPKKCCCSKCGWTCVAPVQVKPGRCPPIKPKCPETEPKPECEKDSDCDRNKKCCNICGKSCWAPEPEPYGSCPVTKDVVKPHCSAVHCSRDVDCEADEKCCLSDNGQKCVKPYPAVQSACPRFHPESCPPDKVKNECMMDVECPRMKKCCCTACGRKCVTPLYVKPGRCPYIPSMCAAFPPDPQCETDVDCPEVQKCCNICGFGCHAPAPEPRGVCPVPKVKEKMLDCPSILCSSDSDCGEKEKCCLSKDTKKCMWVVEEEEELSPSGMIQVCPSFNNSACLPNISYPIECQRDKDCSSSQKCCCSGCSLICMSPKEVKPGRCPSKAPDLQDDPRISRMTPECLEDSSCPNDMKCCPHLGFRCFKPILEPPGTCRALNSPMNATCSFFTCTRHDDCPITSKCCPTEMGKTCMIISQDAPDKGKK